jgi:hypothetical protein
VAGPCSASRGDFGSYSTFKIWDESEFPETFAHPLYWLGIGILFALAALRAFVVRRKTSILDRAIVVALCSAAAVTFAESAVVLRDEIPSEHTFTVAVFTFDGDDDVTKSAAGRFRRGILDALAREDPKELEARDRGREIKGETLPEELHNIRR